MIKMSSGNMEELYVLAKFDEDGNFLYYIRKGRNNSISGYDNLSSAKRGLSQTKTYAKGNVKIVKVVSLEIVE